MFTVNRIALSLGLAVTAAAGMYVITSPDSQATTKSEVASTVTPAGAYDATLSQADQDLLLEIISRTSFKSGDDFIQALDAQWSDAFIPPSLEIMNFISNRSVRNHIVDKLSESTGQNFGTNSNDWYRWLWNEPEIKIEGYDNFKANFYKKIDPKFGKYFKDRASSARIRLDEIRWGGVRQDGIPPLRGPKMLKASQADYLDDDDVVFGIEVNGDVRAFPKRILAWHEMFVDNVGGVDVAGVYCTLCGTVILYDLEAKGLTHQIGTSGFLYRSNKLMYDRDTQSLWNTLKGEPVLGPLVDKGIALDHRSVVTTTWGRWKELHPETTVLSLDTGHRRNYDEGVAYHDYFSTDDLMFNTPYNDTRLKNKQEVLALRFKNAPREQLAISADYLKKNPVYKGTLGEQNFVVLTDKTGANRVYDPMAFSFAKLNSDNTVTDTSGKVWQITESKLVSVDGESLPRLPYHRAFWFGWHASYPDSKLIK